MVPHQKTLGTEHSSSLLLGLALGVVEQELTSPQKAHPTALCQTSSSFETRSEANRALPRGSLTLPIDQAACLQQRLFTVRE